MNIDYLIKPYDSSDFVYITTNYIEKVIANDDYLLRYFLLVSEYLENFTIDNGKIKELSKDKRGRLFYQIELLNREGTGMVQTVIKQLEARDNSDIKYSSVFEIRINDANTKDRILFFVLPDIYNGVLLTYGFTKIIEDKNSDKTNHLMQQSCLIEDDIKLNDDLSKWIGEYS